MKFIQIVEMSTKDPNQVRQLVDRYRDETQGVRTTSRSTACRDRDDQTKMVVIAEFESYEEAMRNSGLPQTSQMAEQMSKLADGPITYRNLDVTEEYAD